MDGWTSEALHPKGTKPVVTMLRRPECLYTAELHLSGLAGTASHPDMKKIRIIGFFFEKRLHGQIEVGKKILQTAFSDYIFLLCSNKTLIHNSLYVLENLGEKFKS